MFDFVTIVSRFWRCRFWRISHRYLILDIDLIELHSLIHATVTWFAKKRKSNFKMTNFTSHLNQETIKLSTCSLNMEDSKGTKYIFNPYFFVSVNVILSITSLSGNILILAALPKVLSLHPPSKLLFQCLSCTDLFVGLLSQPLFITYLATISNKNWSICGVTESLTHISSAILCGESINTLTAISVDRLLALLQVVNYKRVRLFVIISWSASFSFALTYLWNKRFFFLLCSIWIATCLAISTSCYARIYVTLYRQRVQVQNAIQRGPTGGFLMNIARYQKTVSSALWVHLTMIVCYLPYTIAAAVSTIRGKSSSNIIAWNIAAILVLFNSSLNPALYCWKIREVRHAVKEAIGQYICSVWAAQSNSL